jgi:hypothetical protein
MALDRVGGTRIDGAPPQCRCEELDTSAGELEPPQELGPDAPPEAS